MKIVRHDPDHPDRKIDLQDELDAEVSELVSEANDAGYGSEETIEALEAVVDKAKIALEIDPDPAEDP